MQISSLIKIPEMMGIKRIIGGIGVPYPLGNPHVSKAEEERTRQKYVERALRLLEQPLIDPA